MTKNLLEVVCTAHFPDMNYMGHLDVLQRVLSSLECVRESIDPGRTSTMIEQMTIPNFYIYDIFFGELEMSNTVHTLIYTFTSLEYFIIELDLNI